MVRLIKPESDLAISLTIALYLAIFYFTAHRQDYFFTPLTGIAIIALLMVTFLWKRQILGELRSM